MKTWLRRDGLVLLIYIFLAPILTFPLITHFDSHVPGQPIDAPALAWNLWWFKFAIFNLGASPLTTDYLYYPLGVNMVANTSTFLNGLIALPLTFVFGTIIAQNLIIFFALVIGGYGTFLLAREILARQNIQSDFACALAGAFYAFGAWHINYVSAGHFMLLSNEWIPFFALYLIRFERARWRNGIFAGLFFVMTAWTELTFIPFVAVLTGLFIVYVLISNLWARRQGDKETRRFSLSPGLLVSLSNFATLAIFTTVGIAPQLYSLFTDTLRYGYYIAPGQGRAAIFSAEPISYFVPSAAHPIVGTLANALTNANTSYAFIGLAALAFAILGFIFYRQSREIIFWGATALFFALVLLGPTLMVGGQNTNIPMPFAILRALPFVNANRYPVRYNAMMMLALAPLIALGVAHLQKQRILLGALVALFAFEQIAFPVVLTDLRAPDLVRAMRDEPGDFTVMDLPLGWRDSVAILGKIDYVAQFLQTYHEKRLIGGLVSRHPDFKYQYYLEQPVLNSLIALENGRTMDDALRARDRELAPDVLRFFNVRYVIATRAMTDASVLDYAREVFPLEEIYRDDTRIIFRVTNSPAKLDRINLDEEAARLYFDDAWGRVQFSPEGLAYRWSARDEATLWLPLEPGTSSVTLRLRGAYEKQTVHVMLNGQSVAEMPLSNAWANYTIPIRAPILREGVNEFVFKTDARAMTSAQDNYAIGDTGVNSPVDISVTGAGFDAGRFGAIWVAGKNVIESKRGYHLVAINAQTGVVDRVGVFDTFADKDASARLAQFIADLPRNTIVAGVAIDDVSKNLQANAIEVLRSIGVESDLRLQFRAGHAFIGVKGAQVGQALDSVDGRLPANVSAGKNVASDRVGFAIAEIRFDR